MLKKTFSFQQKGFEGACRGTKLSYVGAGESRCTRVREWQGCVPLGNPGGRVDATQYH